MEKEFDVVVFGATGFTGSLVANYLLRTYGVGKEVKWVIAGRSPEKLSRVVSALRQELGDDALRIPVIVADASDPASLRSMAARARVVASTVGPYLVHGSPLIQAVASTGTDYVDLTGESLWVRRMEAEHGDVARQNGARIVHSCGFDCIPSDLGVLVAVERLMADKGVQAERVETYITDALGGFSGGTMATAMTVFAYPPHDAQAIQDPYYLAAVPFGTPRLDTTDYVYTPSFSTRINRWTGFTTLSPVNAHVVRRTAYLLGHKYGYFKYTERLAPLDGAGGLIACAIASYAFQTLMTLGTNPLTRPLLARVLPAPGQGPSREDMLRGRFALACYAEGAPNDAGERHVASVTVSGRGDPGYWLTSQMLAESALCLAKDGVKSPGGSLTPGSCMGMALVERLQERGVLQFTVNGAKLGKNCDAQLVTKAGYQGGMTVSQSASTSTCQGVAELTASRRAIPKCFLTGENGPVGTSRSRISGHSCSLPQGLGNTRGNSVHLSRASWVYWSCAKPSTMGLHPRDGTTISRGLSFNCQPQGSIRAVRTVGHNLPVCLGASFAFV